MGKENAGMFLKNRELYFDEWRFQQISDPRFSLENMNKMLRDARQEEVSGKGRHLKRFGLKLDINELQKKKELLNKEVENLVLKYVDKMHLKELLNK